MEEPNNKSGAEIEGRGHGGGLFRWVWITGVILVLYVLSIGPVMLLTQKGVFPARTMVVYQPVIGTAHMSGWLDGCLWRYCKLWGVQ